MIYVIVVYIVAWLIAIVWFWTLSARNLLPVWLNPYTLAYECALIGAIGGILYCLRAVYINRSVRNSWDPNWNIWYFVRPLVSMIAGFTAFIFLKAGLLILDAEHDSSSAYHGFLAFSFVAGLNVDRFLYRLEEVAKSLWGIRPSRTAEKSEQESRDN